MNKTMKMNTDSGNSSGADVTKKVDVNGTAKSACAFPTSSSNLETQERTVKMHTISSTRLSGIKTRSLTMDRFKKVLRNVLFFPLFHHCSNVDEAVADSLVGASHEQIDQSVELNGEMQSLYKQFELHEEFARGGQGVIYTAKDLNLNRMVAIKSLRTELNDNAEQRKNFITEAKVTAQLNHPAIVPIYALAGDDRNGLHLAMKKLSGITLQQYMERISRLYSMNGIKKYDEAKSLRYRLDIFLRICDAMEYAHNKNVLHCDLKPENIMIGDYHDAYIMDWGIAHPIRDEKYCEKNWVKPESVSGTPRYVAPEVIVGELPDQRADIFSMGAILFELVTLQPAFSAPNSEAVLQKIIFGQMTPVEHLYKFHIDNDLEAIIQKACATSPGQRYSTITELSGDLRHYLAGQEVSANPDTFYAKIARSVWKHRKTALAVTGIIFMSGIVMTSFSLYRQVQTSKQAQISDYAVNQMYSRFTEGAQDFDNHISRAELSMQIMAKELLLRIVDRNPVNEGGRYDIHDVLHEESLPSKTAAGTPSNFKESSFYHRLTDMDAVTYKIQEDCDDLEAVKQKIQRAASLVPEYKADVLWSGFPGSRNSSPDIAALEKRALNEGMPLMRFAVGFKEGACVHYPAVSCFPENYDVRKRFWYTSAMAAKENTLIWSKPYYDIMPDTGLMITCSMPLIYNKHRYGAFSIDFSIKSAGRTNILKDEMLPYIMEKAVIDSEGNILLSTLPEHIPDFVGDQPENVLQKKMFHSREMLENVKHGRTGKFSCVEQGRPVIYLFIRLSSLDWIYIEKIDYIKQMEVYSANYYTKNGQRFLTSDLLSMFRKHKKD